MNELRIFEHPEFGKIRTIVENGKTLFCGKDVAAALGYKRPNEAITAHCKGTVKRRTPTKGGEQEMLFIPQGDIYRLAAKSELPGADEFESWIFDDVLPSIHEHGAYMTPATIEKILDDPDTIIRLATSLKEEREKRQALETENLQLQTALDQSKEWYSIKRVAALNGCSFRRFDWRKLKRASIAKGYGVKKIFDANYGEVNVYHMDVWESVYPEMEL